MTEIMENTTVTQDQAQWMCIRECSVCKTNMTINSEHLHMRRNLWTLGIKKEFFTICKCKRKIHVSKTYINDEVMKQVEKNNQQKISPIYHNFEEKITQYTDKIMCQNCKTDNRYGHNDIRVRRCKNYEIFEIPDIILVIDCVNCNAQIELDIQNDDKDNMIRSKVNELVVYDTNRSYSMTKSNSFILNAIIGFELALMFPISIPVVFGLKMADEFSSKDIIKTSS